MDQPIQPVQVSPTQTVVFTKWKILLIILILAQCVIYSQLFGLFIQTMALLVVLAPVLLVVGLGGVVLDKSWGTKLIFITSFLSFLLVLGGGLFTASGGGRFGGSRDNFVGLNFLLSLVLMYVALRVKSKPIQPISY